MVVLLHCTLVGKDCCTGEGRGAGKQSSSEDEADMGLTSGRSQQQTSKIKMTFELLVVNPNFQMRPASGGVGCADAINFAENFRSAKPVMQPAVCLAAAWHRCYGNLLGCVHHLVCPGAHSTARAQVQQPLLFGECSAGVFRKGWTVLAWLQAN